MTAIDTLLPAVIGGAVAGLLTLACVLWLGPRDRPPRSVGLRGGGGAAPRRFSFHEGYLVDHDDPGGFLLPRPVNHLSAWDDLRTALSDLSPEAGPAMDALRDAGEAMRIETRLGTDTLFLSGRREGTDLHVTVAASDAAPIDPGAVAALEAEASLLSHALDSAPALCWAIDEEGRVSWANAAYMALVRDCHGDDAAAGWPIVPLFPAETHAPAGTARRRVLDRAGQPLWYEVSLTERAPDGTRIGHGQSLAAAIRAENGRQAFIQTLTKTFAVLPDGLAIFDPEGALAQFNPALMDMTGLDPEWLSRRPRLSDVFDALRERQRLPEPRDYKAWRDAVASLGRGGSPRPYSETWSLPDGTIYRVTARPHSDGSVTLLFEDVSADVASSRDARRDRTILAAMLDAREDAAFAFDSDGTRRIANAPARALWADRSGLPQTLEGCIGLWQAACRPSSAWGDLRDMQRGAAERAEWTEILTRRDGTPMEMRVTPLPENRLCVIFATETPLPLLTSSRTLSIPASLLPAPDPALPAPAADAPSAQSTG